MKGSEQRLVCSKCSVNVGAVSLLVFIILKIRRVQGVRHQHEDEQSRFGGCRW